jgi:hypothetical protein
VNLEAAAMERLHRLILISMTHEAANELGIYAFQIQAAELDGRNTRDGALTSLRLFARAPGNRC